MIFREIEDRDAILRARRGDVEAYNLLVSRWERRIFSYLVRIVGDREDALDLSQETFLKAYRGLPRLEEVERFPQWLFRIAHNEAMSLRRRKRPEIDPEQDPAAAPERRMEGALGQRAELSLAVDQALARLPEEQREAVLLKVYQGFKFNEIAAILECPVSTVKSRVYAGFEALKSALAPAAAGSAG